jgi:hypothetical protein
MGKAVAIALTGPGLRHLLELSAYCIHAKLLGGLPQGGLLIFRLSIGPSNTAR